MSELNFTHSNGNKVKLTTPDTLAADKTFKLPGTDGSVGQVLQTDGSGALSFASQAPSNRRLNYNGAMLVNQRGDSSNVTNFSSYYGPDRYYSQGNGSSNGTWNIGQSTDVPDGYGFKYSLSYDCVATTSDANRYLMTLYRMEGFDSQVFNYGTANAKTATLSFWIKCSKAGNFQVNFENEQNPDAGYQTQQTINSANTWEKKVVTIPGDTNKAFTWTTAKAMCFDIVYSAFGTYASQTPTAAWSTLSNEQRGGHCNMDLFDSTSNYVRIAGVQFELGDHATEFEHLPYQVELQRCQRYYEETYVMTDAGNSYIRVPVLWKVEKRVAGSPVSYAKRPDGAGTGAANKSYQADGERTTSCNYSWTGGTMVFVSGYSANTDCFSNVIVDVEI